MVQPHRAHATLALVALVKIGAPISERKSDNGASVAGVVMPNAHRAGLAPREGGIGLTSFRRRTPLRAPKRRAGSPTRGERGVCCDAHEIFEDASQIVEHLVVWQADDTKPLTGKPGISVCVERRP